MRENSELAHYHRYVLSGVGTSACLPSRAHSTEFSLAYLVAFQHTVFYPIFSGHGIHHFRTIDASAISPRQGVHAFHDRRQMLMKRRLRLPIYFAASGVIPSVARTSHNLIEHASNDSAI